MNILKVWKCDCEFRTIRRVPKRTWWNRQFLPERLFGEPGWKGSVGAFIVERKCIKCGYVLHRRWDDGFLGAGGV